MIGMEPETIEDEIRAHAHALWIAEGQPEGRADEHWRLAREAIDAERSGRAEKQPGDADPSPAGVS